MIVTSKKQMQYSKSRERKQNVKETKGDSQQLALIDWLVIYILE